MNAAYNKNKFYIQNGRCYCWNIRKEYKTSCKNEVIMVRLDFYANVKK